MRASLAGLIVVLIGAGTAAAAEPVTLAPHRAVYEISLARASGGGGVANMSGRMVYEITGSTCAGYSQSMRFVTRSSTLEGAAQMMDMRSSSSEDREQKKLSFSSSQYRDSRRSESVAGEADRGDGGIVVELTQPRRKQLRLDKSVMYPIQHSIALIEKARAGESTFEIDVYDGAEKGEKLYSTVSLIGPKRADANKGLPEIKGAERLNGLPAWPLTISYFDAKLKKQDVTPSYVLSFLYFENGVSRRLLIDYGDFAIRGTLKALEFLEPTPCEGAAPAKK